MTDGLPAALVSLAAPLLDPASRTWWPLLLLAGAVAGAHHLWRRRGEPSPLEGLGRAVLPWSVWTHRSSRLDLQLLLFRRLLALFGASARFGGAWWLAVTLVRGLDGAFGAPALAPPPPVVLTLGYSLALFVAWDASRWALHRAMHELGPLWQLHQVHHSAEVLTPLTFHRVHPVEAALYDLRGALVGGALGGLAFWLFRGAATEWTVLGVHGLGVLANAATGNLRHSHVWLRFPAPVERWLLSPAQHQLHHSIDPADHGTNYGTWLAIWDRATGTLRVAGPTPPAACGVAADQRNHAPDDLIGALVGPLVAIARRGGARWAGVAGLWLPLVARGQDPAPEPAPEADAAYEIVVVDEGGVPRVAGSAHVITEEELDRYEATDIHQVLARVPGVYVRSEDGYGLRPNLGLRGANSDRSAKVALMEDGIPLAPAPYAAPAAYYFPMTQRLVGVEVFKGPAAIRHGPQTVGGAINLRTRPTPTRPDGEIDLALGQRSLSRLHAWGGTGDERWGLLLEGAHLATDGFKVLDDGGPTGFVRQDLMLKLRRSDQPAGARSTLELKLGYGREDSNETYLGLSLDDFPVDPDRRYAASQDDRMTWQRTQAELTWRYLGPQGLELRAAAWHHGLGRAWTRLNRFAGGPALHDLLLGPDVGQASVYLAVLRGDEDSVGEDQNLQIGTNDRTFRSGGVSGVAGWRTSRGRVSNQLEVGTRLMVDDVVRVHTEDPFRMSAQDLVPTGGPTLTLLDRHDRATALATHAHDDLALGPAHLIPGVRVEWIRGAAGSTAGGPVDPVSRTVLLPGLGASVEATGWLDLFAGVHRGFSPVAPGSPAETRPETSTSWELGGRATPGETHAELVGFVSDYQNLTGQCTLSGGCSDAQLDQQFNGGAAWVGGVESVLEHRVHLPRRLGLLASASYTLTWTAFRTGFVSEFPQFGTIEPGDALPYVPLHQGGGQLVLEHPRGQLACATSARSPMRDVAGQGEIPLTERIPPTWQVDLAADAILTPALRLYGTITNLFDQRANASFRPFGARPIAPFQANVGLKVIPR